MDIGDPSEIPATRRRLPSMHDLGAFDIDPPVPSARAQVAAAPLASAAGTSARPTPARSIPSGEPTGVEAPIHPTASQLRHALAAADPATRRRLLRLFGKGRPAGRTELGSNDGRPLLRLDAGTELLAAMPDAAARSSELDRLLAQARAARPETAPGEVPRVLFPVYDPCEHGPDLRRPGRSGGPIEGHFPPPRPSGPVAAQPERERTSTTAPQTDAPGPVGTAEARLPLEGPTPTQPTPTAAAPPQAGARDGINGLLLSPRDLDAAVEDGLLGAETAAVLWQTWSARRPVIHVVDDPDPAPIAGPQPAGSPLDAVDAPATMTVLAAAPEPATPAPAGPQAPAATSSAAPAEREQIDSRPAVVDRPASGESSDAAPPAPLATRRQRAAWLVRLIWRGIVIACVLSTGARLALQAWPQARPWLGI